MRKRRAYTTKELEFIKQNYKTMQYKEIGNKLGRTSKSIEARVYRLGLRKRISKRKSWRGERLKRLKELYPYTKNKVIAKELGTSVQKVRSAAARHGLKKAPDYIHEGHYKAGQTPHNTHSIGTIIERAGRVVIKVTDNQENPKDNWVSYQYYLWVSAGNEPPSDGKILRIKPQYVGLHYSKWTVEHIECVTMAEHMERNTINRYPQELISAIRLLSHIRREIEK